MTILSFPHPPKSPIDIIKRKAEKNDSPINAFFEYDLQHKDICFSRYYFSKKPKIRSLTRKYQQIFKSIAPGVAKKIPL